MCFVVPCLTPGSPVDWQLIEVKPLIQTLPTKHLPSSLEIGYVTRTVEPTTGTGSHLGMRDLRYLWDFRQSETQRTSDVDKGSPSTFTESKTFNSTTPIDLEYLRRWERFQLEYYA